MMTLHRPRLIATDLDGTFLSPDGSVSERNAKAVIAAHEAGVPFVFATGRPSSWLSCLKDIGHAHPLVIVSNGAAVFDIATGALSQVRSIPAESVVSITQRLREQMPDVVFGVEFPTGFGREHALEEDPDGVFGVQADIPELVAMGETIRILAFSNDLTSTQMHDRTLSICPDEVQVTYSAQATYGFLELMAAGVTKATSLSELCESHDVDAAHVAAFGDMLNDVEMLDWVGMPFRMEEGHPLMAERGYRVAGSNTDSGVGRTVEMLLQLPV